MANFSETLTDRLRQGAAPAVVGLDPRLEALPADILPGAQPTERILAFYQEVLPLLARHVPLVKPNIAFFERHGAAGFGAYEATCRLAREHGLLVIGDIKRGDIGSTAQAYADGHCSLVDAVTLNPYLGGDALAPFLEAASCIAIPGEEAGLDARSLTAAAIATGIDARPSASIDDALTAIAGRTACPARVLISGSLYLAGAVLAANGGMASGPSAEKPAPEMAPAEAASAASV